MIRWWPAPSDRVALIAPDDDVAITYADLDARVREAAAGWAAPRRQLVFLRVRNDLATVLALLSLLHAGHAVVLVDFALSPDLLAALVATYGPDLVVGSERGAHDSAADRVDVGGVSCTVLRAERPAGCSLHPDLALCLVTSGSTGSPKLVRLSSAAVAANAQSIAAALHITGHDRAITCLPLHYAYGLSILTSHLAAGASVVLTEHGVMDSEFWVRVRAQAVTSLAGVPYTYDMMERLGLARVVPPSVRVMTQAGGRLSDGATLRAHAFMQARGGRFHVMYGQTEAVARMAVMPHDWLPEQVGAAGRAIPGGAFEIWDADGTPMHAGGQGEIIYHGPNVMLGYATTARDLALGDEQHGVLRTGDLGSLSATGALRITGRLKRMGKLFGVRVDLDMLEGLAGPDATAAVVEGQDRLIVYAAGSDDVDVDGLRRRIATRLDVQQRLIDVRRIAALPRTASGKVDYPKLSACA